MCTFSTQQQIPVIDLQDFPSQSQKLREACEKWGCLRIINHGVPAPLMQEMKWVIKSLFDLPVEIKERNKEVIPGSGYMAPSEKNPLYEAFGLFDAGSVQAVCEFCTQLEASPPHRKTIEAYAQAIHKVAMDTGTKLAKSMGVAGDVFEGWPCQLRINKYSFTEDTIGSNGVQIHTDSGFLTILHDDENVGGLEVMDESGSFLTVDPWPGTLLMNLGDIAKVWSNGKLRNVQHRVQCREASMRYSIATFLSPRADMLVEPPPELISAEHPRLYKPFTYEEFRGIRASSKLHAGEALELVGISN